MKTLLVLICFTVSFAHSQVRERRSVDIPELVTASILLPGSGYSYKQEPLESLGMLVAQTAALGLALDGLYRHERSQTHNAFIALALLKVLDIGWTIKLMNSPPGIPGQTQIRIEVPIK